MKSLIPTGATHMTEYEIHQIIIYESEWEREINDSSDLEKFMTLPQLCLFHCTSMSRTKDVETQQQQKRTVDNVER